ncbi:GntR family transcriptional regulator [Microcella alkaliphila]|jgi:DNA-binding transcriptional regulator YhcF (GntR family)|uniref:Transcriptional regulator n=1 Tax=Microcella alkaliphila TaxID=279828 RepID=A0A0U5BPL1_9MICO|nr:GntR family transcriptional regulator [Microcella alkaliphila]BAU32811.1 transcriptional regulator [Microcella alkaliphila]
MDDGRPIFLQLAERIEDGIIDGTYPDEGQLPSINDFAAFHRINPATALKGIQRLVDAGVVYKRRGVGMFVSAGARERLLAARRDRFAVTHISPLLTEARTLGLTTAELIDLIRKDTPS